MTIKIIAKQILLTIIIVWCIGFGLVIMNISKFWGFCYYFLGALSVYLGALSVYYLSYKFFQPESPTFTKNNNQNKREEEIKNS